jgi:hypothetical protein
LLVLQRKRGRQAVSKSAKSKMGRKSALAYISSSGSEGERNEDDDFDPTVRVLYEILLNYLLTTY